MISRLLKLNQLLKNNQSTFLFGPRGVGKTMLSQAFLEIQKQSWGINLLNLDTFRRYSIAPELFRKEIEAKMEPGGPLTVLVDEVQKLPSLLDEVHFLIEKYPSKIQFLLTGSSARKLKRGGANLLAGRAWDLHLHPFTSQEVPIEIEQVLWKGSLPSIWLKTTGQQRTLQAYVNTYLKEEIMQEALVRQIDHFVRFLEVAGQMNGEPMNFSEVGRQAGVSTKTIQEYYSILEDTLIAFRLDGWTHSVRKQLQKAPKYYFFDCGVLNAINHNLASVPRSGTYQFGKLFETFIIQELFRLNDYWEGDFKFHYWRTNSGLEVDLILSRGPHDPITALEIKASASPQKSDLHALSAFASENKKSTLLCLCQTPQKYKIENTTVLPWQEGLKAVFQA